MGMSSTKEAIPKQMEPDVTEICVLLQAMGFKVKSVSSNKSSRCLGTAPQTISLTCQISGTSLLMESSTSKCNCSVDSERESCSLWKVCGVSSGLPDSSKETVSLLKSLPEEISEYITSKLAKLIEIIRSNSNVELFNNNENVTSDSIIPSVDQFDIKEGRSSSNAPTSLDNLYISPRSNLETLERDTPTRYRSLDTLTSVKNLDDDIPKPGSLIPKSNASSKTLNVNKVDEAVSKPVVARQQDYTFTPTQETIKKSRRSTTPTSSPSAKVPPILREQSVTAEKTAKDLQSTSQGITKPIPVEDEMGDPSEDQDVTKPNIKLSHPINKFASSPNLSGSGMSSLTDTNRPNLTRVNSISTSRLVKNQSKGIPVPKQQLEFKNLSVDLQRILSPPIFSKHKLTGLCEQLPEKDRYLTKGIAKPKRPIPTCPITKKKCSKFDHVKSTIPKPTKIPKKEEK